MLLGTDFYVPDHSQCNGGKWALGFHHVTGMAGNGGKFSHAPGAQAGRKGWTCRNQFIIGNEPDDPCYRATMLGTYQYNAETSEVEDMFGMLGRLRRDEWNCIEVYMKINTYDPASKVPAANDGILRAWVNGKRAFEKTNYKWRNNPPWVTAPSNQTGVVADQAIQGIWWNSYFGGVCGGAPQDCHHFIKNIVISTEYVGPMKMA